LAPRNLSSRPDEPARTPGSRPLRVLVVDDERDAVLTLLQLLRDEGHEVRGVYRGRDVANAMRDFEPDAILLDIAMPEVSGWDVARQIRSRLGEERPFLIALSGVYKQSADKVLGQIVGFDYYLSKPCEPAVLLALLASLRAPDAS
jgi:DNA-binding response OmpR family regulator